jgi:cobalt/nickel transport protein
MKRIGSVWIAVTAVALAVWPLLGGTGTGADFEGTDALAEELALRISPDYRPWARPLLGPPSAEVQTMLFSVQAALGAGVAGFALGRISARKRDSR